MEAKVGASNDYDLMRYTWDYVPHFTKQAFTDPETQGLVLNSFLVFSLVHVAWAALFAYVDITGKWDQYRVTVRTVQLSREGGIANYIKGLKNFAFDLFVLFLPTAFHVLHYHKDSILRCEDPAWLAVLKLSCGYVVGKIWSYWVHRGLHSPILYRHLHKKHHITVKCMVSSHAWYETIPEFIVMELPNIFIAVMLAPTHTWVLYLYFAYHATGGAIYHSGYYVNWVIDGRYHYNHHYLFDCNFGELETLDIVFKTHSSHLFPGRGA
jgi:sterol desaturase/sphingolipid hydroxylase (fatty acid hydroxylase superfamily)